MREQTLGFNWGRSTSGWIPVSRFCKTLQGIPKTGNGISKSVTFYFWYLEVKNTLAWGGFDSLSLQLVLAWLVFRGFRVPWRRTRMGPNSHRSPVSVGSPPDRSRSHHWNPKQCQEQIFIFCCCQWSAVLYSIHVNEAELGLSFRKEKKNSFFRGKISKDLLQYCIAKTQNMPYEPRLGDSNKEL